MRIAARMDTIGTESAFEVTARARALEAQGRSIIHLQIGEPDFDTPANVRQAAKQALDEGFTHYAPFSGIPQLRDAIAEDATARKGFEVTPDRVFVTVGGKGVMLYGIRTDQQFRLARAGYRVQALIAYGEHWYPWYMRRLAERPANVWFALRQMLP